MEEGLLAICWAEPLDHMYSLMGSLDVLFSEAGVTVRVIGNTEVIVQQASGSLSIRNPGPCSMA